MEQKEMKCKVCPQAAFSTPRQDAILPYNLASRGICQSMIDEPVDDCRLSRYHCRLSRCPLAKSSDLIQGTLDLLVLKTLARGPIHGWGIAKRIEQLSDDVLSVGQGSLYPALHRLEQQGWISAEWKDSELSRPTKFYWLTREGKKQLESELKSWARLSSAVALVLRRA
jgi:PadR family transcriptional regulator PadR